MPPFVYVPNDRLAELRTKLVSSTDEDMGEVVHLLQELESRRLAEEQPSVLVWHAHGDRYWSANNAGSAFEQAVVQERAPSQGGGWSWKLSRVDGDGMVSDRGDAGDAETAKKAVEEAWADWCRYSDLRPRYPDMGDTTATTEGAR